MPIGLPLSSRKSLISGCTMIEKGGFVTSPKIMTVSAPCALTRKTGSMLWIPICVVPLRRDCIGLRAGDVDQLDVEIVFAKEPFVDRDPRHYRGSGNRAVGYGE